ncbi:putative membrane protein [Olavius sp. associated proteobacterium Delta 1]|nr:putative membrane protein [Olavius sp. associated proteobacterium Delta 1]
MRRYCKTWSIFILCFFGMGLLGGVGALAAEKPADDAKAFPRSLESYNDSEVKGIGAILKNRIMQEPFNLIATLIFFFAIIHTFLTSKFTAISHKWEHEHDEKKKQGLADRHSVHHGAELFHFLGEVEAVFGIWVIALSGAIFAFYDWKTVVNYISYHVNFTEAMFVVVIMTLASTRPILKLTENIMWKIANLLGGTLTAWWFTILTIGPLLGSLITEPAAMTISALLLGHKLYDLEPSEKFKYATIGLLFVNISVGGTLTHFAAPPVLMVAGPWEWGISHMAVNFGWKALMGILISNGVYYAFFRKELAQLQESYLLRSIKEEIRKKYLVRQELDQEFEKIASAVDVEVGFRQIFEQQIEKIMPQIKKRLGDRLSEKYLSSIVNEGVDKGLLQAAFDKRFEEIKLSKMRESLPGLLPVHERPHYKDPDWDERDDPVPVWVTIVHAVFMAWTIVNAHHPEMFIPGMLFFLGFAQVTSPFQNRIDLKPALLVGFFLGGLVIHGGVQGWWIAPVLGNLTDIPLMLVATVLTAFNDNAAITYLSTLVPGFTDNLKYAVVAGAVAGGGLTVIANAPNPAGQSILKKYFENGVSPIGLLKAAFVPTLIVWLCFLIFR